MENKELNRYVEKFKYGDDEAFNIIYEETKKIVYLSIYPIIKTQSIIEDLMQDTYMKFIQSIELYEIGTNFKAWISKIAHNLAINYYNANKKVENIDDETILDCIESSDKTNEDDNYSLIDHVYEILENNYVENEKEIFTYKIIFNMNFKEIAMVLNIPKSTVFDMYKRMIKKIKSSL